MSSWLRENPKMGVLSMSFFWLHFFFSWKSQWTLILNFISEYVITIVSFRTFTSFEDLVIDYEGGELHPEDLKPALAKALNRILQVIYLSLECRFTTIKTMIKDFLLFGWVWNLFSSQLLRLCSLVLALSFFFAQPVRDHFNNDPKAKELLQKVKVCTSDLFLYFDRWCIIRLYI